MSSYEFFSFVSLETKRLSNASSLNKVRVSRLITLWRTMKERNRRSIVEEVFHERRRDERVRKSTWTERKCSEWSLWRRNWRTARKMRETRGDFSDRTALENCGFELACTISRCLLHPSACGAKREEGVPRDRDNRGFKGEDCIQAHVERLTPVTSASFQPIAYPHSTDVTTSPVVTCIPRRKGGARVR